MVHRKHMDIRATYRRRVSLALLVLFLVVIALERPVFIAEFVEDPTVFSNIQDNANFSNGGSPTPQSSISKYDKLEVKFDLNLNGDQPFVNYNPDNPDPNENEAGKTYGLGLPGIDVQGEFIDPLSNVIKQPAFYYQGYNDTYVDWGHTVQQLNLNQNDKGWRVRWAPDKIGNWQYRILVIYKINNVLKYYSSSRLNFNVIDSSDPGLIGINSRDTRLFQTSNGETFTPIGHNIPHLFYDLGDGGIAGYKKVIDEMSANNENTGRIFIDGAGIDIEPRTIQLSKYGVNNYHKVVDRYSNNGEFSYLYDSNSSFYQDPAHQGYFNLVGGNRGATLYSPLGVYAQDKTYMLDQILEYARNKGVYIQLGIYNNNSLFNNYRDPYFEFTKDWEVSQYLSYFDTGEGGGPAVQLNAKDEISKAFYSGYNGEVGNYIKRKLRYIQARWGYNTKIFGFELNTETGSGLPNEASDVTNYINWHQTMRDFLNNIDPFNHLVPEWRLQSVVEPDSTDPNKKWEASPTGDYWNIHFYSGADVFNVVSGNPVVRTEQQCSPNDWAWKWEGLLWFRNGGCGNANYIFQVPQPQADAYRLQFPNLASPAFDTAVFKYYSYKELMSFIKRRAPANPDGSNNWSVMPNLQAEYDLFYMKYTINGTKKTLYQSFDDKKGQFLKNNIWASNFLTSPTLFWPYDRVEGPNYKPADPLYAGVESLYKLYKPLGQYMKDVDFAGLKMADSGDITTNYSVDNNKILSFGQKGNDKAYLYVKNLTNNYIKNLSSEFIQYASPGLVSQIQTPVPQSANLTLTVMNPGVYDIEVWDTDPDKVNPVQVQQIQTDASGKLVVPVSNVEDDIALKIKFSSSTTIAIPTSNLIKGWNLVSFPLINNDSFSRIFTEAGFANDVPTNKLNLKLRNFIAGFSQGYYQKYDPAANTFVPASGKGYWFWVGDLNLVDNKTFQIQDTNTVSVGLAKGWNLIGNPYLANFDLSTLQFTINGETKTFDQAVSSKSIEGYAYAFDRSLGSLGQYKFVSPYSKYNNQANYQTKVEPYRGFWIYVWNTAAIQVTLNKP